MRKIRISPYCDGVALLLKGLLLLTYKGKKVKYNLYFYKCQVTGKEFTTDEMDDINL